MIFLALYSPTVGASSTTRRSFQHDLTSHDEDDDFAMASPSSEISDDDDDDNFDGSII